jgi:hypothetical protein
MYQAIDRKLITGVGSVGVELECAAYAARIGRLDICRGGKGGDPPSRETSGSSKGKSGKK